MGFFFRILLKRFFFLPFSLLHFLFFFFFFYRVDIALFLLQAFEFSTPFITFTPIASNCFLNFHRFLQTPPIVCLIDLKVIQLLHKKKKTRSHIKPAFFTATVDCSHLPSDMSLYSPLPLCFLAKYSFWYFTSDIQSLQLVIPSLIEKITYIFFSPSLFPHHLKGSVVSILGLPDHSKYQLALMVKLIFHEMSFSKLLVCWIL